MVICSLAQIMISIGADMNVDLLTKVSKKLLERIRSAKLNQLVKMVAEAPNPTVKH